MDALMFWASLCGALTLVLTYYGATSKSAVEGQSVRDSMLETWTNIAVGFTINYIANLVILPLAGFDITITDNFLIGVIYTFVSIVRQYNIRRIYNKRTVRKANGVAEQNVKVSPGQAHRA